jgi:hypothetical protein
MPVDVYKLMHLLGLFLVLIALGGLALHGANGGSRETQRWRRPVAITHGLGLLLLLVGGFGMLAKLGAGLPPWAAGKLVLWLALGAALGLLGRRPALGRPLWFVVPLLALGAAMLAIYKPGA